MIGGRRIEVIEMVWTVLFDGDGEGGYDGESNGNVNDVEARSGHKSSNTMIGCSKNVYQN